MIKIHLIEVVSAYLLLKSLRENTYIAKKIDIICKSFKINLSYRINFYLFLHFEADKELI